MGIFAVAAFLGWKLVGTARSLLATSTTDDASLRQLSENGSIPTVFEEYADAAPVCHDLTTTEEIDFTLVTQLSQDRLWMMKHHCQRFPYAISIAVYSNASLSETWEELQTMGCDLNLVTVSVVDAQMVGSPWDYPVNILRNTALEKVQTTHLIYIDVDFWLSEGLYDILNADEILQALVDDPKLALVLPAFMLFRQCMDYVDCRSNNIPLMPTTKRGVLEMMVGKRGHIFDPTNRGGHGSTLYKDWIRQDPGTLLEIPCLQSHRYEPFVVVRWCQDLPPFPTAFNGYGKNKLAWMMQVMRRGYALSQVGGAFVVHYPHLDSAARTKWNEAPKELQIPLKDKTIQVRKPKKSDGNLNLHSYKRGQVDQLFVAYRKWLEEQVPDDSRVGMCEKAQDDDSKLWIDKVVEEDGTDHHHEQQQAKHDAKAAAIQKDNHQIEQMAAAAQDVDSKDPEESDESEDGVADDGDDELSSTDDGDGQGEKITETER